MRMKVKRTEDGLAEWKWIVGKTRTVIFMNERCRCKADADLQRQPMGGIERSKSS
jgi:hypothetical protein